MRGVRGWRLWSRGVRFRRVFQRRENVPVFSYYETLDRKIFIYIGHSRKVPEFSRRFLPIDTCGFGGRTVRAVSATTQKDPSPSLDAASLYEKRPISPLFSRKGESLSIFKKKHVSIVKLHSQTAAPASGDRDPRTTALCGPRSRGPLGGARRSHAARTAPRRATGTPRRATGTRLWRPWDLCFAYLERVFSLRKEGRKNPL